MLHNEESTSEQGFYCVHLCIFNLEKNVKHSADLNTFSKTKAHNDEKEFFCLSCLGRDEYTMKMLYLLRRNQCVMLNCTLMTIQKMMHIYKFSYADLRCFVGYLEKLIQLLPTPQNLTPMKRYGSERMNVQARLLRNTLFLV